MIDINYYRQISNSLDCTQQESDIYESQNALLYDFDSNPSCKTVLLNNVQTNVIVYEETDIITGGKSYKVRLKPNVILRIGDVLDIDNEIWFVTKVDIKKTVSYSGTLAKATCILKFYKNGIYRELPCYINIGTRNYINEIDNDYIRLPKSLYTAYCPDLGYLTKEDCNIRFYIRGYVYRAIGIDNLTVLDNEVRDGLIIMKLIDDAISDNDNVDLGIADYWDNQDTGTINGYTSYDISTDLSRSYLVCGEKITINSTVKDEDDNLITTDCIFSLTDLDGNTVDYIDIVSQDNASITLKVNSDYNIIGNKVKLCLNFPQLIDTTYECILTIHNII